jgi:hypothetical protein
MENNKFISGDFHVIATDLITGTSKSATAFMVYCDYIAHLITKNLKSNDDQDMGMLKEVGKMRYDLSEEVWFVSSKKTIEVTDINGSKYKITVEAV